MRLATATQHDDQAYSLYLRLETDDTLRLQFPCIRRLSEHTQRTLYE